MIELPDKKKCYNLPEQVAQNLRNIEFLATEYKNIDALPAIWQTYKEEFDSELETFGEWTNTFAGWTEDLSTYLASMSSAAVGAIAGQNIAPNNITSTGSITANSIIENMGSGYGIIWINGTKIYVGAVKNGNKLTVVVFCSLLGTGSGYTQVICDIAVPPAVSSKLYPYTVGSLTNVLDQKTISCFSDIDAKVDVYGRIEKTPEGRLRFVVVPYSSLVNGTTYLVRYEATFLLSDSL